MKNVVVFGSQKIAVDCINLLRDNKDINILCVIGSESPSDKTFGYISISQFCKKENLKYFDSDKLDNTFIELLEKQSLHYCFSFYYRKIFDKKYLDIPSDGFINIHPSLLPKYRGPVPSMWALLNGDSVTGVTIHYIDEGIDSGDIIAQKKVEIDLKISGFELHNKLMDEGVDLFRNILPKIVANKIAGIKQNHEEATYYGPFNSNVQNINWYDKAVNIYNRIRTFKKPYLGVRAVIRGNEITIWSAEIISHSKKNLNGPGKIVEVKNDNSFIVSAVDGFLLINEYEFKDESSMRYISPGNTFSF